MLSAYFGLQGPLAVKIAVKVFSVYPVTIFALFLFSGGIHGLWTSAVERGHFAQENMLFIFGGVLLYWCAAAFHNWMLYSWGFPISIVIKLVKKYRKHGEPEAEKLS